MPVIRALNEVTKDEDVVRVLVTGFGSFGGFVDNPSWLAIQRLNNVILETEPEPEPVLLPSSFSQRDSAGSHFPEHLQQRWREHLDIDEKQEVLAPTPPPERSRNRPTRIHITALQVPVTYPAVLDIIPKLHARPPILPPKTDRLVQPAHPPEDGYDFVLHVGVGAKGALKVEKRARRWGYAQRDADGGQCEIGRDEKCDGDVPGPGPDDEGEEAEAERFERERIRGTKWGADAYRRGFGQTYEGFEDELRTEIDVEALVDALRTSGFEHVSESTNAGLYLCEFIYYCSLAESLRTRKSASTNTELKGKDSKVLFVHCPPVGNPYRPDEVAEALKRVVEWVVLEDGGRGFGM